METIKSVVQKLIQQMSHTAPSAERMEELLAEDWSEDERKHIRLIGIKDDTAAFTVDSPAWLYHFESRKPAILKKLRMYQPNISKIRFKSGHIT